MSALGIDIKLLIAQVVNFVLFFILVKKFIAQPFLSYLKNQKKIAEEKEEILKTLQKKEDDLERKSQEVMKEARLNALKLQKSTKKELEQMRNSEIHKMQEEIAQMRMKAEKQIEEDRKKMVADVRTYIIDTSIVLVKKSLSEYLDEAKQKEVLHYITRQRS